MSIESAPERTSLTGSKPPQLPLVERDPSKTKMAIWLPILLTITTAIGSAGGWMYERYSQQEKHEIERAEVLAKENQRLINEYLVRIQVALSKTKVISDDLNGAYLEPGWGILESYVIKARRDGHDKNALMYQHISRLIQQNTEVVAILDGYEPYAITEDFKKQAAEFRDHALRYIDRWEVVPKVIVTKQMLPIAKVFPTNFPAAVKTEIEARKKLSPMKGHA